MVLAYFLRFLSFSLDLSLPTHKVMHPTGNAIRNETTEPGVARAERGTGRPDGQKRRLAGTGGEEIDPPSAIPSARPVARLVPQEAPARERLKFRDPDKLLEERAMSFQHCHGLFDIFRRQCLLVA